VAKVAQRQFLVEAIGTGIPGGFWATRTGGEANADATYVWDGGNTVPDVLAGPRTFTNLVLSRPYDPTRDGPFVGGLRAGTGRLTAAITEQVTDGDLVPQGGKGQWNGLLTHVKTPELNAASNDAATIELTFMVATGG
jgi:hypothetical protein